MDADLSADTALTTALIARPLDWRVRIVERLEIDTATSGRRSRSLQSLPLRTVLPPSTAEAAHDARTALVVLNVASVPRGALLDLDVSGPGGAAAFLLPRAEIASRECDYLLALTTDAGLNGTNEDLRHLLEAVLGYTSTGWNLSDPEDLANFAVSYLEDGFGQQPLPEPVVARRLDLDRQIAPILAEFADPGIGLSPTEHPLLALPFFANTLDYGSSDWHNRIEQVLMDYLSLIKAATEAVGRNPQSAAHDLLSSLADYGRNYDMLVATTVPLDEPFLVKYSERRALSWSHNQTQQDLVISDALSNHVVLAVDDPNVRITAVKARTAGRDADAFGAFTTRQSKQTYAVYAHDPDRDYRVTLEFTLAPLRRLQFVIYTTTVLVVLLAAAVAVEHPSQLRDLALIIGPSALAASVLLNREPSTLGSHLRRRSTAALGLALVLLLLAGTASYLIPRLPTIWSSVESALSAVASRL